jgi:hypothetical protein
VVLGKLRPQPSEHAERGPPPPRTTADWPRSSQGASCGSMVTGTRSARPRRSTRPFASKNPTAVVGTTPVRGICRTRPREGECPALAGAAREPGTHFEETDVGLFAAAIVRHAAEQPGTSEGRRTAKVSESGVRQRHQIVVAGEGRGRRRPR